MTATRQEAAYKEIGQLCYEGYAAALGWRTPSGEAMLPWNRLGERQQNAFREGARRAMQLGWTR